MPHRTGNIDAYHDSPEMYQEQLLDILRSTETGLERRTLDHRMDYAPEELGLDGDRYDTGEGHPPCDDTYHQAAKRFTRKILRDLWKDDQLDRVRCDHGERYLTAEQDRDIADTAGCTSCPSEGTV